MIVVQGMTIAAARIVAGVAAALALTALAASCGPAIKGALVDPPVALRCE